MVHPDLVSQYLEHLSFNDILPGDGMSYPGDDSPVLARRRSTGSSYDRAPKKRGETCYLEHILCALLDVKDISIRLIEDVPSGKKHVKKIHAIDNDHNSHYVWAFKANTPEETARELQKYSLVHSLGIPTAKPMVPIPKKGKGYNYDVAMIGCLLPDEGLTYDYYVAYHRENPGYVCNLIAQLIADTHKKLHGTNKLFADNGICIPQSNGESQLESRLFGVIAPPEYVKKSIISAVNELYTLQESTSTIIHGDLHTKQILIKGLNSNNSADLTLGDLRIIDFDLALAPATSDIVDFWVHAQRLAISRKREYISLLDFAKEYSQGGVPVSEKDLAIQQVLWHTYELFDPARIDHHNLVTVAQHHLDYLSRAVSQLTTMDQAAGILANQLESSINTLIKNSDYCYVLPSK